MDEAGNADPTPDFRNFIVNKWVVEVEGFSARSSALVLSPASDVVQCDQAARTYPSLSRQKYFS